MAGNKENVYSDQEFHRKKLIYKIRDLIPFRAGVKARSLEHHNEFLMHKWSFLKGCKTVLDAGCGNGEFMRLNPFSAEIHGVDILKEKVDVLKKEGFKVKQADVTKKIPHPDGSFDAVISLHVLEHLEDPVRFMREIRRVLKKEGLVVIAVPNFSFKKFFIDYTHKRPYPRESLYRLLRDYGFQDVVIMNGVGFSKILGGIFLFLPRVRFRLEKLLGLVKPYELIALGVKK